MNGYNIMPRIYKITQNGRSLKGPQLIKVAIDIYKKEKQGMRPRTIGKAVWFLTQKIGLDVYTKLDWDVEWRQIK
jgi:hypothetical protein